jgi:antitoxin (DNA-binding transcriptional repressor) of toxin-antitoxin stability system
MGKTTIRELRHDTTAVLGRVTAGETIEVRRRDRLVAILTPPRSHVPVLPDFAARLREIYGDVVMPTTGTDLVREARGER